jgi:hypothetical protein
MPDIFFAQEWLAPACSCYLGGTINGIGVVDAVSVRKIR